MDYFLLRQDERYVNTPIIKNMVEKIDRKYLREENLYKIEDLNIFRIMGSDYETDYLDILDTQIYLYSDRLMELIRKFDEKVTTKRITLIDIKRKIQRNYHLPILEEISAFSKDTEIYSFKEKHRLEYMEEALERNQIKKLILDADKIKDKQIFKIKEIAGTAVVVDLHVAEALLRRDFKGIKLERIDVS
ncbi:hypothetical protein R9X47_02315 [Wukongibacter baidiensis]|uniref:imm11 family protein n=1 Tax=Wukongibacter baidiensis TaxID=1723361 RepID=UPI003D8001BA